MTGKKELFEELEKEIRRSIDGDGPPAERLEAVCELLRFNVPHYHWVGFYVVDRQDGETLRLGPFAGKETEHTVIAFGKGVCGRSAATGNSCRVDDVKEEDDYLSCDVQVKSEIVIPVKRDGELVGQIDIDSHDLAAFEDEDEDFLAKVAEMAAPLV